MCLENPSMVPNPEKGIIICYQCYLRDDTKGPVVRVLCIPSKGSPRLEFKKTYEIPNSYSRERVLTGELVLCYNDKRSIHPLNEWLQSQKETRDFNLRGNCLLIQRDEVSGVPKNLRRHYFTGVNLFSPDILSRAMNK